jgi:hypothetical protein
MVLAKSSILNVHSSADIFTEEKALWRYGCDRDESFRNLHCQMAVIDNTKVEWDIEND